MKSLTVIEEIPLHILGVIFINVNVLQKMEYKKNCIHVN